MVDPHANGCPEPEVLAAYVDHGLSLSERARVDAHLASCPQCVALLAGAVRTVAELSALMPDAGVAVEATSPTRRRSLAGALTAAAAVIAVLAAPALLRPWLDRDSGLVSLVDSVAEHRSVLGRLTGGFPHAPLGEPSAGGQGGRAAGTDHVQLAGGRIRESFGGRETPSQLHAFGVSELLAGRYDDAAQALLAASREQPNNARYLNDVATVQLERARRGLRADDLPRALGSADRARRLDPSLREAWFNRALAMSMLSLRGEARTAWARYLAVDSSSAWAHEARTRLADLEKPSAAEAWAGIEQTLSLSQSIDPGLAERAVGAQTTEARNYIEALLATWAEAAAAGDGRDELARVRTMADAFRRVTGDPFFTDTVGAIDRAEAAGRRREIAAAHQAYAASGAIYREDRYADAAPGLTQARDLLTGAGSPFSLRPAIDLATIDYVRSRHADATAALDRVIEVAGARGYIGSIARAQWVKGLIAFVQGRMADTQARYEDALAEYERMGDAEQVASAHNGLAALFFYLGDEERAWDHHPRAMKALEISRSPRLWVPTLASAATSARFSNPAAALAIQEEAVAVALAWGRPVAIAEALALRAALRADAGLSDQAEADIAGARQYLARMADAAFRERVEVAVLSTESDLLRQRNPAAAAAAATRAISILHARGDRSRLAPLHLRLAKANIVWGNLAAAESALTEGIKAFDAERSAVTTEARSLASDASWDLFTTSVQLAIRKKDYDVAFMMAERSRLRSIGEARRTPATRSLRDVQSSLAPDQAVVALNQFDDELAVWIIRAAGTEVLIRPLNRGNAARLVARQQDEVWSESSRLDASRELFNEILRPAQGALSGVTQMVVVPDAAFENASFAGLWDSAKKRFLVESVVVSAAPSVNAFASARAATRPVNGDVLVFGGSDPRAIDEARAIAGATTVASVVTGEAATRSRLFTDAAAHGVVHVAAPFGTSGVNPLLSRMHLADEPGTRHSGTVLGSDVAAQTLSKTRLVVMDEVERDSSYRGEGTLSMARAFMAAGVPAVVATLPGANEQATRDLMIAFHRQIAAGDSAAQALSTVQRNAIQQNGRRLGAWSALVLYGSDR